MRSIFALLTGLAVAACIAAIPAPSIANWTDPPFSVPTTTMAAAITCPRGVQGKSGGVVFLVHGTASDGNGTWSGGPYNLILPNVGPGYDVCWVTLPGYSWGNAAESAEYVAYNIKALAAQSATNNVFVIGWSQGAGLNIQWALDFFPSTLPLVSGFISLAGDFHGSAPASLICNALTKIGPCMVSVFQQMQTSQFLKAQNISGGMALVGTTSIYTNQDPTIYPEPFDSTLSGASNILIQDPSVCGSNYTLDHLSAPYDNGVFGLAVNALAHSGVANIATFDKSYCSGFNSNVAINVTTLSANLSDGTVLAILSLFSSNSQYFSKREPLLPEYVCQRYPSAGFDCTTTVVLE